MTDAPRVSRDPAAGALAGLRVVDASTLFAGPMAAMHLGDLGADVVKVEHPTKPDPSRTHGAAKDGVNLWWKTLGRNKRTVTANLGSDGGREVFLALVAEGRTNDEIAHELFLSRATVKTHLVHVYDKLGAPSRTAAVAEARRRGLLRG